MISRAWLLVFFPMVGASAFAACSSDDSGAPDGSTDATTKDVVTTDAAKDAPVDAPIDVAVDSPSDAGVAFEGGVTITEFTIPIPDAGADAGGGPRHPRGITAGPDGNMWFGEYDTSIVGNITPGGVTTEFHVSASYIGGIAAGSDGALWFTDLGQGRLGRITTTGVATYAATLPPDGGSSAVECVEITAGPDGALWCTGFNADAVVRMAVDGGTATYRTLSNNSGLRGIASVGGHIEYAPLDYDLIGTMSLGGVATELAIPDSGVTQNGPFRVAGGSDGRVWYDRYYNGVVGNINDAGVATEYPLSSSSSAPAGMALGADGNMWVVESTANKIARVTPTGAITEYPIATSGAGGSGIAAGPANTLWFTEYNAGKIARIQLQ